MEITDYEQAVLSSVFHDPAVLGLVATELSADRFSDHRNEIVWTAMLDYFNEFGNPPDVLSLQRFLSAEDLSRIGDLSYLRELEGSLRRLNIHSTKGVPLWVQAIDDAGRLRQLEEIMGGRMGAIENHEVRDVDKFCSQFVEELYGVQTGRQEGFQHISTFVDDFLIDVGSQLEGKVVARVPTGWPSWDSRLGGGLPIGLTLISARPAMGKTQTALLIARNVAERAKRDGMPGVVGIISLEMTGKQVTSRLVCAGARIDSRVLDRGLYAGDEEVKNRIEEETSRIRALPIHVDQSDWLTAEIIGYRASVLNAISGGLLLLIIDFAELISSEGERDEMEETRVSKIFLQAKALAKKLKIPVILICQQNRSIEQTQSKLPSVSAIRWSGMAEAVADLIVLVYNPAQYERIGATVRTPDGMPAEPGNIYYIIGKQREGGMGHFTMSWHGPHTRIWDRAEGIRVGG